MLNFRLDHNPEFNELPEIEVGDQVVVHDTADVGFRHNVKAEVVAMDGDDIIATVIAIFDRDSGGEMRGGDIMELMDKNLVLQRVHVFKVLKQTAHG
jgi:hypothetical protein